MKTPVFTGSGTAIVTPFSDGGIDFDRVSEQIEFQHSGGTAALLVCGTTGETPSLSTDERKTLIDFCVRRNDNRMKIVAGIGSNNTYTALEAAKNAEASGADAVLMVTPYYNKTSQAGLVAHFTYVADRIGIPLILYNIPGRTGIGITAKTYKTLSEHPNINGVKEASGDFSLFAQMRALCGDELNVWSGNDDNTLPMMSMGAKGVFSVASNIVPGAVSELCRLCLDGDFNTATEHYFRYAELFAKLFIEVNPIPVKAAMKLMSLGNGELRLPLVDISSENLELLSAAMKSACLI